MSVDIRRILIEAAKPANTSSLDLSQALCSVDGVEECDLSVTDVDTLTHTIKLSIKGPNVNFAELKKVLDENSVAIKGVDEVSVIKTKKTRA